MTERVRASSQRRERPIQLISFFVHQWYGTEYDVSPLDVAGLVEPIQPAANLSIPDRNIFVPSKLDLLTNEATAEPKTRPSLIYKSATSRLFFKQDDTWCIPRASLFFLMKTLGTLVRSLSTFRI